MANISKTVPLAIYDSEGKRKVVGEAETKLGKDGVIVADVTFFPEYADLIREHVLKNVSLSDG